VEVLIRDPGSSTLMVSDQICKALARLVHLASFDETAYLDGQSGVGRKR